MPHPIRVTPPPMQSLQPTMPVMKGLQAASEATSEAAAATTAHPIRVTPPAMQSLQPTMPVLKALQAATETGAAVTHYDPARLHPVFFADTIQRAPVVSNPALASPVALGYGYPRGGPKL